jgi:hypothetical protein
MHEWLEYWKPLADWLVAIGTIGLGLFAFFAAALEHRWNRSELIIKADFHLVEPPNFAALVGVISVFAHG